MEQSSLLAAVVVVHLFSPNGAEGVQMQFERHYLESKLPVDDMMLLTIVREHGALAIAGAASPDEHAARLGPIASNLSAASVAGGEPHLD